VIAAAVTASSPGVIHAGVTSTPEGTDSDTGEGGAVGAATTPGDPAGGEVPASLYERAVNYKLESEEGYLIPDSAQGKGHLTKAKAEFSAMVASFLAFENQNIKVKSLNKDDNIFQKLKGDQKLKAENFLMKTLKVTDQKILQQIMTSKPNSVIAKYKKQRKSKKHIHSFYVKVLQQLLPGEFE
jgi:hypothetical protein